MVAGRDAKFHGKTKYSRLTGTAAWTFVIVSQYIPGIYPTHNGLSVDPCVPLGFGDFTVTRKFREGTYHIQVRNPGNVQKGVASMTVNGKTVEGHVMPYEQGRKDIEGGKSLSFHYPFQTEDTRTVANRRESPPKLRNMYEQQLVWVKYSTKTEEVYFHEHIPKSFIL